MLLTVFAARDLKGEAFLQPFYSINAGSAMRAFGDAVNDAQTNFNKHPEDYVLFEIGTYDDCTGLLKGISPVKLIVAAVDLLDRKADMAKVMCGDKAVALGELAHNGKKA